MSVVARDIRQAGSSTLAITWSDGEENLFQRNVIHASSSWLGIDAFAPDPDDVDLDTVENLGMVELPTGPYYLLDAGLASDPYTFATSTTKIRARAMSAWLRPRRCSGCAPGKNGRSSPASRSAIAANRR